MSCCLGGCSDSKQAALQTPNIDVDPPTLLSAYIASQTSGTSAQITPAMRSDLASKLGKLQAAAKRGESIPDIQASLELARLEFLAKAAARSAGVYEPVSDDELRASYRKHLQELPADEFHVAHILVATEQLAKDTLGDLQRGKPFGEVARERSADESKLRGGDIGWIRPGHLPKELFNALDGLGPGEYGATPVRTGYGWHVVMLVNKRAADTPSFEEVERQLEANIQRERYERFLDESVAQAKKVAPRG